MVADGSPRVPVPGPPGHSWLRLHGAAAELRRVQDGCERCPWRRDAGPESGHERRSRHWDRDESLSGRNLLRVIPASRWDVEAAASELLGVLPEVLTDVLEVLTEVLGIMTEVLGILTEVLGVSTEV